MNMMRYMIGDKENQFIARIRDNELVSPAPFSNKPMLILQEEERSNPKFKYHVSNFKDFTEDVPVAKIAGIYTWANLDNFASGMTFRDVLFKCLHGACLTEASLDYFVSDCIKSDRSSVSTEFPQDNRCTGKLRARGGVGFVERKGLYFAVQGQQRTIMAMFYIYQKEGRSGLYKQVRVTRPVE